MNETKPARKGNLKAKPVAVTFRGEQAKIIRETARNCGISPATSARGHIGLGYACTGKDAESEQFRRDIAAAYVSLPVTPQERDEIAALAGQQGISMGECALALVKAGLQQEGGAQL